MNSSTITIINNEVKSVFNRYGLDSDKLINCYYDSYNNITMNFFNVQKEKKKNKNNMLIFETQEISKKDIGDTYIRNFEQFAILNNLQFKIKFNRRISILRIKDEYIWIEDNIISIDSLLEKFDFVINIHPKATISLDIVKNLFKNKNHIFNYSGNISKDVIAINKMENSSQLCLAVMKDTPINLIEDYINN